MRRKAAYGKTRSMKIKTLFLAAALLIGSSAFADTSYCDDMESFDQLPHLTEDEFAQFVQDGNKVGRIVISKDRKQLYLVKEDVVLKTYHVAFGGNPVGHKQFEGDQKTPEGIYTIDSKNPKSAFYLGLHVSYPNKADVAYAKSKGRSPGGHIMIHGFPSKDKTKRQIVEAVHPMYNWTDGCIAVNDQEIYEIYPLIRTGTTVEICKASK